MEQAAGLICTHTHTHTKGMKVASVRHVGWKSVCVGVCVSTLYCYRLSQKLQNNRKLPQRRCLSIPGVSGDTQVVAGSYVHSLKKLIDGTTFTAANH